MHNTIRLGLVMAMLLVASAATAQSQVYRWVDKDGAVHYSDHPESPDAKTVDLPQLQTFKSNSVSNGAPLSQDSAEKTDASIPRPVMTSPTANQTIRNSDGSVTLAANATFPPGGGLLFYIDGATLNATPIQTLAWNATGVERGEHRASVAVADADGKVVARSEAVVFYMMQPGLLNHPQTLGYDSGLGPDKVTGLAPQKSTGLGPDKLPPPPAKKTSN